MTNDPVTTDSEPEIDMSDDTARMRAALEDIAGLTSANTRTGFLARIGLHGLDEARRLRDSDERVSALNAHQCDRRFHPYTCPGDYPECADQRELVATRDGWVCKCGKYRQQWAHGPAGD